MAVVRLLRDTTGAVGTLFVLLIVLLAVFAPLITPYAPDEINVLKRLAPPSAEHWMGTDQLGRDTFTRLVYGTRIALLVSLPAVIAGAFVGMLLGLVAGYLGGWVETGLLWLFDVVRSFPALLFAIAVIALTGPSLFMIVFIMALTRFPSYGRLIRAQTLKIREEEFVAASQALGCSPLRVMLRHILPNAVAPLFIQAAMDVPVVITFEAGLSFLGLGVPPPTPSWGSILREGYTYVRATPWLILFGSGFLVVATLGFTFFAEALRDVFDVKIRNEGAN
ncbi:MAG: ABC transporter permease [Trueperaceae bacterium]|nr:MAG: ABC transporter permease [Trueperaceae bacterium]